jgi:nitrogen fixation/metabolism regulation signal transduction histidine kinase
MAGQIEHLRRVLEGMRAYAAEPHLDYALESLRSVVEESVQLARALHPAAPSINLTIPDDCAAEVARSRVVQAFTNLLVNAIESYDGLREPHDPIVVRGRLGDGFVELCIEDRGSGMSEIALQDAPKLFASNKKNGTGVGLPLAIKIIEAEHAGVIAMTSARGSGTTARIVLPAVRSS